MRIAIPYQYPRIHLVLVDGVGKYVEQMKGRTDTNINTIL